MELGSVKIRIRIYVGYGEAERAFLQHAVGIPFEVFGTGPGGNVAVAGRVDYDFRAVGCKAVLVGYHYGVDGVVGRHFNRRHPGEEEHVGSRLLNHSVVNADEVFGIDCHPVELVGGFVGHSGLSLPEHLLGQSAVDDFLSVGEGTPGRYHPRGPETSEIAGSLDQQGSAPF